MLSSFFESRPAKKRYRNNRSSSPFASSLARTVTPPRDYRRGHRRVLRYEDDEGSQSQSSAGSQSEEEQSLEEDDTEGVEEETIPLLPIFDSAHLDKLPTYTLTHTIRLLVSARCDTTLSWDQLRSPQVSQFLLKPIQREIRANHFSAATIYCLMANCLQFTKEIATNPANSGTIQTRAMVCELLAIKLLREHTTRGLIDALSYDFDPLQDQSDVNLAASRDHRSSWQSNAHHLQTRSVRISCLEIAIRAQAKRFIAHPVVVQQLEAIWSGSIVFHAAADSAHRRATLANYGSTGQPGARPVTERKNATPWTTRKVVTLYNPRDASLFKLSRLRVPRYRNTLSTISFAILLGLFVAVLVQRSTNITALEIVFWFWAAGYMIDEIVGFSEQGFGLYIASFWNVIDLGIIVIFFIHLCLRLYGILMPDVERRKVASSAFDLLAADAILLFPRLFSVLDHYRYFSQLIIAFRLMAADFIAVMVLLVISCSGFFVALTLSFGFDGRDSAPEVAYALLQMILGFTPAVWDRWSSYTVLGRAILVSFMFLSHFLILTILITVLTNSFMAVVKNANEEHQFLFAVNTISSVKSESLFSYVPPLNVLQWLLNPLRYALPFRQYVKLNRTIIKITHFPILFAIYAYERVILQSSVVDRIDVVQSRSGARSIIAQRLPGLVKEPSRGNIRQDQALEEVFKQPLDATLRTEILSKQKSSTVVNQWMHDMGEGTVVPPQEDDLKTVEKLAGSRLGERSLSTFSRARKPSQRPFSVASDPIDLASHAGFFSPQVRVVSYASAVPSAAQLDGQDDSDGDDELQTNDNEEDRMTEFGDAGTVEHSALDLFADRPSAVSKKSYIRGSAGSGSRGTGGHHSGSNSGRTSPRTSVRKRPQPHLRNTSSITMIYSPEMAESTTGRDNEQYDNLRPLTAAQPRSSTPGSKNTSSGGRKTPRPKQGTKLRPMFPNKNDPLFQSAPNLTAMLRPVVPQAERRASLEMDLVSDLGDNNAIGGGYVGAIPASFAAQMALAVGGRQQQRQEKKEEQEMFGRLMMARMNSLEEGFREVIHEMRENMRSLPGSKSRSPERPVQVRRERRAKDQKGKGFEWQPATGLQENDSAGSSAMLSPKHGTSTNTLSNLGHSAVTVVPTRQETDGSKGENSGE